MFNAMTPNEQRDIANIINADIAAGGNEYIPPGLDNTEGVIEYLKEGHDLPVSPALAEKVAVQLTQRIDPHCFRGVYQPAAPESKPHP